MPGPAPRREAEVRRSNNKGRAEQLTREQLQDLPFEIDMEPDPLPAPEDWHPLIEMFWAELKADPARKWMTSADWAATAIVLEAMSRELSVHVVGVTKDGATIRDVEPVKGATLMAFLKHLGSIGVTEDARMRLRKEVTLFPQVPRGDGENVVDINRARQEEVQ